MNYLLTIWNRAQRNIRYKLLILILFPIVLVIPVAVGAAIFWGHNLTYEQLYIKVNTDLSVANNIFRRLQDDYLRRLERFGESYAFREAWGNNDKAGITSQLQKLRQEAGFSYLLFNDTDRFSQKSPSVASQVSGRESPLRDQAVSGQAVTGVEVFSHEDLHQLDSELARQVELPLLDTPFATPTERRLENRGMMLRALYPLKDPAGKVLAILDAGVLLNNNFELVDAIRDLVYGEGSLPKGSLGTVTIFLDDVRISTNVPLHPGERALGTRVSEVVRNQVLGRGENWVDRAFVVNDWYISGYSPINDSQGKRLGILYAGYLEAPFRQDLWKAVLALVILLLVLLGLSLLLLLHGAQSIFNPLERISRVIGAARSDPKARVGKIQSQDEIAELAQEFDALLDLLQQRNQEVQNWADELENKVGRRTDELTRKNADLSRTIEVLSQTRRKLVVAEKLAALGELTAGVAHEINNPAAVILGNMDMLSATLGHKAKPVQQEIDLIIEQIYRIQDILNNLLQYARPGSYSGALESVNVNEVVDKTFRLIEHLRRKKHFHLDADYQARQTISINAHELQQVLVNLIRNAIHVLPEKGGLITVKTSDWTEKGVKITVTDNGTGIPDDQLDKIFNPFYTTKKQAEGTGLGLSLSYSLIHRYGGNISVQSRPGQGTTFTIWILLQPKMIEDERELVEQLVAIEEAQTLPEIKK
ncbi:MAG: sensor histidine kinase [Thiolinea sp.]